MNVVIMNKEEKIVKILINPKIEVYYNNKRFTIAVNDVPYPTPYDDNTIWDFTKNWEGFILMQTDNGWIIDKYVERVFRGKEFEHYVGLRYL